MIKYKEGMDGWSSLRFNSCVSGVVEEGTDGHALWLRDVPRGRALALRHDDRLALPGLLRRDGVLHLLRPRRPRVDIAALLAHEHLELALRLAQAALLLEVVERRGFAVVLLDHVQAMQLLELGRLFLVLDLVARRTHDGCGHVLRTVAHRLSNAGDAVHLLEGDRLCLAPGLLFFDLLVEVFKSLELLHSVDVVHKLLERSDTQLVEPLVHVVRVRFELGRRKVHRSGSEIARHENVWVGRLVLEERGVEQIHELKEAYAQRQDAVLRSLLRMERDVLEVILELSQRLLRGPVRHALFVREIRGVRVGLQEGAEAMEAAHREVRERVAVFVLLFQHNLADAAHLAGVELQALGVPGQRVDPVLPFGVDGFHVVRSRSKLL
mmetsp:Transcript_16075/g.52600  ORF Transcript_16075/g.52600 Transcript_16075/m.52600 type:complete len:381 (-) Transcript_16075:645-1787(-)